MGDGLDFHGSIDGILDVICGNDTDRALTLQLASFQHALAQHCLNCFMETRSTPETNPLRGQGQVIAALKQQDGIATKDLAAKLSIRTASLNELLVKLETKNLVRRQRSADDGRVMEVYLTDQGRAVNQMPLINKIGIAYGALAPEEKETLTHLLGRLTEAINSSDEREDGAGRNSSPRATIIEDGV